jgi:hypothetical protein
MHDVYEVAQAVNELAAGYDYLLSVVQTAEPQALADVAALRAENERLRAEREESGGFSNVPALTTENKRLCAENAELWEKLSRGQVGKLYTDNWGLQAEIERLRERLEAEQLRSETFADLEAEACEENRRLRARIAELEPAAANWALVEAMPAGARLEHDLKPSDWEWTAWIDTCDWFACRTPAAALRAALGKPAGEGE